MFSAQQVGSDCLPSVLFVTKDIVTPTQQKAFLVKFEYTFVVRFGIALLIFHVFQFCCEC